LYQSIASTQKIIVSYTLKVQTNMNHKIYFNSYYKIVNNKNIDSHLLLSG